MSKAKHKHKVGRHWRRTITVIAILLILVGVYGTYRRTLSNKVQAKLDAIRAAGYPVTLTELDAWYAYPPPGQPNAADLYLQAAKLLKMVHDRDGLPIIGNADLPPLGEPMSDPMRQAVTELLAANSGALKLLHEAAALEHARYPFNLRLGMGASPMHLGDLRSQAHLMCLEAVAYGEAGRTDQATQSVAGAFRVARSLMNEPVVVSQLVRVTTEDLATGVTERLVNLGELKPDHLAILSDCLAGPQRQDGMTRAMAGWRCTLSDLFQNPSRGQEWIEGPRIGPFEMPGKLQLFVHQVTGNLDRGHLAALDIMTARVELSTMAPFQAKPKLAALDTQIVDLPRYAIWSRQHIDPGGRAQIIEAMSFTRRQAGRMALAVEQFRIAHGRLPQTLEDVAPEFIDVVPIDPFDGKLLRYRKLDKGFVVYSVGEDGVDDSGVARDAAGWKFEPGTDITFTIAR